MHVPQDHGCMSCNMGVCCSKRCAAAHSGDHGCSVLLADGQEVPLVELLRNPDLLNSTHSLVRAPVQPR